MKRFFWNTPQRRLTICREGWYYLVVLGLVLTGALMKGVNLLLILTGMLAGPLWFNWRLVLTTLRGLDAVRRLPHGVCAGDMLVVHVELHNTRRRYGSWAVVVHDEIHDLRGAGAQPPVQPAVLFSYVRAGETKRGVYRGRLHRRGRYRFGPLRVSTRFPFGLFRNTLTLSGTEEIVVLPRLGRLTQNWGPRRHEAFAGAQLRERQSGSSGEFYGVRPWRAGDSRRMIHWRSVARHGELFVRQYEQPRNTDLAVLVDLWQPEQPETKHLENVELAASFAATVIAEVCRTGGTNLLVGVTGPQPACVQGQAASMLAREAMEALALAEADSAERLPELLEAATARLDSAADVILISTRPLDADHARSLSALHGGPGHPSVRHLRCFDTSSPQLDTFFEIA